MEIISKSVLDCDANTAVLMYNNNKLEGNITLGEYGIKGGSILFLVFQKKIYVQPDCKKNRHN